jgi:hypothetical protein
MPRLLHNRALARAGLGSRRREAGAERVARVRLGGVQPEDALVEQRGAAEFLNYIALRSCIRGGAESRGLGRRARAETCAPRC